MNSDSTPVKSADQPGVSSITEVTPEWTREPGKKGRLTKAERDLRDQTNGRRAAELRVLRQEEQLNAGKRTAEFLMGENDRLGRLTIKFPQVLQVLRDLHCLMGETTAGYMTTKGITFDNKYTKANLRFGIVQANLTLTPKSRKLRPLEVHAGPSGIEEREMLMIIGHFGLPNDNLPERARKSYHNESSPGGDMLAALLGGTTLRSVLQGDDDCGDPNCPFHDRPGSSSLNGLFG